ncbi:MAG TPA: penicillin acylase family protein, partial [Blastocatellia bacterium]
MKRFAFAAVLLTALSLNSNLSRALPGEPAEAGAERLAAQVTIRRDTYGVPHILAKSEEAAAFGFGYAQAEDHCLAIARHLVAARGETAKYLGQGQEGDFLMKRFDNLEVCKKNFGQLDPLLQRIYNAYAEGVNRYVSKHRNELPEWIPAFEGVDVLANGRAGAVSSAINPTTMRALRAKYPGVAGPTPQSDSEEASESLIPETELPGSNAFGLSGSRTASGKPILLGNPHLNWSSLYWEAQVTVPGKINFFGSTLAGIPVLRAGFNE